MQANLTETGQMAPLSLENTRRKMLPRRLARSSMAAIGKRQDLENVLVLMNPPLIIIGLEQIFI